MKKSKLKKPGHEDQMRPLMDVAVICKVKFVTQLRREVNFQSSLIISNCS